MDYREAVLSDERARSNATAIRTAIRRGDEGLAKLLGVKK